MKEFKGTKEPFTQGLFGWIDGHDGEKQLPIISGDKRIGTVFANSKFDGKIDLTMEEGIANSKLMIAAPKLLQCLIDVRSQLIDGGYSEDSVTIMSIDTVINEAL